MYTIVLRFVCSLAVAGAVSAATAATLTPDQLQAEYEAVARKETPGFGGSSSARGAEFFRSTHGSDWSCSTCHTPNPTAAGRHARTGNMIQPLAPSASPGRFTDAAKVEKWFRRNCGDVLGRACTAQEKGDVVAFLRSLH